MIYVIYEVHVGIIMDETVVELISTLRCQTNAFLPRVKVVNISLISRPPFMRTDM